ncbi:MAG: hypothetical protein II988_06730 [Clostridia bacterium]|nr:hypothetical protein [Clostridia bacterium]MBQ3597485.1 hypothetical protein [Clostridia bacterium]
MEISKRKKLEKAFYNFELNRERAEVNIAELAYCGLGTDYSKVSVQSSKTNAAEDKIIKAIDEKTEAYRWFKVVENTLIKYRDDYRHKLIVYLYFNRLTPNRASRRLNIDRATLFRWKNEILLTAEFWAFELRAFEK